MYIAFLDEFGHIGPFVSRAHASYSHSPVFGLAGFIIPHEQVRDFATWFFQLKNRVLSRSLRDSGKHPATWEKKGADLFTNKNIESYPDLSAAIGRIINKIYKADGRLFFNGREKYQTPEKSNPGGLYTTVMGHSVRQIDKFCLSKNELLMIILDQHSDRIKLLETATKTMFGNEAARQLIEPPFQVESHLYQTIQAADWIATIVGRIWSYRVNSKEYSDWEWAEKRFGKRIDGNATHSSLWRPHRLHIPQATTTTT